MVSRDDLSSIVPAQEPDSVVAGLCLYDTVAFCSDSISRLKVTVIRMSELQSQFYIKTNLFDNHPPSLLGKTNATNEVARVPKDYDLHANVGSHRRNGHLHAFC